MGSEWGRIDDDGTVYVRTSDGEREIGSWQAGDPEAGLAFYMLRFDDLDQNPERGRRRFVSCAIKYQCVTDAFYPEIVGRLLENDLASAEPSSELPKLSVDCRRIRGLQVEIDAEPFSVSQLHVQRSPTLEQDWYSSSSQVSHDLEGQVVLDRVDTWIGPILRFESIGRP